MALFLRAYASVLATPDTQFIGWVTDDKLRMVVGLSGFIGKVCQIHVAMDPGYKFTPQEMLANVFKLVFDDFQREMLIGIVNSSNVNAMRYDLHLGFTELTRLPGMHDDGGDLVILTLKKGDCKYITQLSEAA